MRVRRRQPRFLRVSAAPQKVALAAKREFREKLVLSLFDKGVLGLILVGATALFTTRLETIKAREAQSLQVTNRQIDAITKLVGERLTIRATYWAYRTELSQATVLVRTEPARARERIEALHNEITNFMPYDRNASRLPKVARGDAERLWLPNEVDRELDGFDRELSSFRLSMELRVLCVREQLKKPEGEDLAAYYEAMKAECLSTLIDDESYVRYLVVKDTVRDFVETVTTVPSVIGFNN